MSNARKLQTEIERVMKKVDEGVLLFDEIWEKVYSAEQQNQKEKYEMDLKKEIKKLQRLRDQIKTWIGSSDVKDKEPLMEARKLIETKMEQFKVCEKETKTKTYSKEGLARQERLDPAEEAKMNTTTWIADCVEKLNQQIEDKEVEIERLSSGKGKKTNKHLIDDFNMHVLNHKFHVSKLEGIARLVMNDRLETDVVDSIREDMEYYLDSHEDEDYMQAYDEDFFYEALGLEELDVVNVDRVTVAPPVKKPSQNDDAASSSSKGSKDKKGGKKSALASVIPITIGRARVSSSGKDKDEKVKEPVKEEKVTTPSKLGRALSSNSQSSNNSNPPAATPVATTVPAARPAATPATSMAAILKRETEQQEKERQKLLREQQQRAQAEQQRQQQQQQQQQQLQRQQQEVQLRQQEALRQQQAQAAQQQEALKLQQQQEALRQQQEAAAKQQKAAQLQAQQQAEQKAQKAQSQQLPQGNQSGSLGSLTSGLGGLALGGLSDAAPSVPLANSSNANAAAGAFESGSSYLTALNESFANMPNTVDNERSRHYTPQNPYPTPSSYPSTPSAIFENPAVFEKLGTDCLFFIFYYSQGTYQQYLAARELKKQSWRFHKKYMTWFQRHEEPKVTTDEYEQGTYVYFDYETGWCTRIKQDFRFEYSFLEDSLQ